MHPSPSPTFSPQRPIVSDETLGGRTVLVTGAAGFVGSHVVDALVAARAAVIATDSYHAGTVGNLSHHLGEIDVFDLDVRDVAAVDDAVGSRRPDLLIHLAANADVPASVADPRYDHATNATGTFNVLDAIRRHSPGTRVVVASSAAVYGRPRSLPIGEDAPLAPISPYGASKLAAEAAARAYAETYGLAASVARIFNSYGPRMPRYVVIDFLHKLRRDPTRLEIIGTGAQLRDLSYVSDTAHGLLTIGVGGAPGEAYNVCSGRSCTITELAERLLTLLGLDAELSYTGTSWPGDVERFEGDPGKLAALGHVPSVGLDEGLSRVLEWFDTTVDSVA